MPQPVRLLLDSGAFSIWRKGFFELKKPVEKRQDLSIDLNEYIEAIRRLGETIFAAVNLDVIPGTYGRKPSITEVEASAEKGWKNLQTMRAAGVRVMPVFHQGESMLWLRRMVEAGYDYIGISPANDVSPNGREIWLDEVFGAICDADGLPFVKTHGFGVTTPRLMTNFPWFSVDSASASLHAAYGAVVLPHFTPKGHSFESGQAIFFSSRAREVGSHETVQHYHAFGHEVKRVISDYVKEQGFTLEQLADDSTARAKLSVRFFRLFLQQHRPKPFVSRFASFFRPPRIVPPTGGQLYSLSIFLGFSLNKSSVDLLDDEQCYDRLVSFIHFRSADQIEKLKRYLVTGELPEGRSNGAKRTS